VAGSLCRIEKEDEMISRRRFMQISAMTGAGVLLPLRRLGRGRAFAYPPSPVGETFFNLEHEEHDMMRPLVVMPWVKVVRAPIFSCCRLAGGDLSGA